MSPRGGRRQGKPGGLYPNRSDLRNVKPPMQAAPGQGYGEAKAQMDAQRAVPVAPPPPPQPADLPPLTRPSERPNEPVTAGLPIGPGPGPEVLTRFDDGPATMLRAAYARFPSEELRELIEELDGGPF